MFLKNLEINQKLLPIKVHYFFWQAGISTVQPYLSSYARQLGFSSVVVGFLFTAMPIFSILSRPLFGMMADKWHRQKELFISSQLLLLLSSMAIFFIPALDVNHTAVNLRCLADQKGELEVSAGKFINNCTLSGFKNNDVYNSLKLTYMENNTKNELTVSLFPYQLFAENDTLIFPIKEIKKKNQTVYWCNEKNETFPYELSLDEHFNNYFPRPKIGTEELEKNYWCWLFFIAMIFFYMGYGNVNSLGDAICFELLGDKPNDYGKQRLYGALGWGIFSVISGYVNDILSDGRPITDFSFSFYSSFVLVLIDVFVCVKIKFNQPKESKNFSRNVGQFFLNVKNNVFFMWCVSLGLCAALIWQFLYWLIEDLLFKQDCHLLYYTRTLEGLIQFIETIFGEIPFFFISGWIMKKCGHVNIMSLVLFCFGIRMALYSVISNPWWFLPIELMNGIDFGLCFSCMASYASILAPEGTEATMQSLVGAFYEGIGTSVGSSLAGLSYKKYGGVPTFKYFSYFALLAATLHLFIQFFLRYKSKNKTNTK